MAAVATGAQAIGIGAGPATAELGQPLNHAVGVRLDPGETLTSNCVSAEVVAGESRLSADLVKASLEGDGSALLIRVRTTIAIDEPVVTVAVAVGCPTRMSRRFVLFADPPRFLATTAPAVPSVETQPSPPPERAAAVAAAGVAPPPAAASAPPSAAPAQARPRAPRPPRPQARRVPRPAEEAVKAAAPPRSRLKLDAAEPVQVLAPISAEIVEAAASAAAARAAAQASEQATAAAAARIASLEKSVERLRAESAADRQALLALRQRAMQGEQATTWLQVLAGLVLLLAALAVWLGVKLRRLQIERQQIWWNAGAPTSATGLDARGVSTAADALETAAVPSTIAVVNTRPGPLNPAFRPEPDGGPESGPPTVATERTEPMPVGWREELEPSRDLSIEELIDLEQQAEFFVVLGQEEAAIDLLVDHLRSTGGGSPMPYLKLLEIYRRRGDREAYERTRARFNHRFNAYAPDWDADVHEGRSLEDYPSIVARLQMAWPSPIDAMAELESLLFRKARGDLFDMPAYRDVLFLYSLARDLLDREPHASDKVDVLLPIKDGGDFTQPMSLDVEASSLDSTLVQLDAQPTVPVDLDVTHPVMPESLFGEEPVPVGGKRRRR